jgi:hypothetical protein
MPNYNFAYYYAERRVRIRNENAHHEGTYLISLRLDTQFMQYADVRAAVGFLNLNEYTDVRRDVTIDLEKTFHCAASKGLVGHIGFVLRPEDPAQPSAKWGPEYAASIAYFKDRTFSVVKTFLVGRTFVSPGDNKNYKVVPETVKEKRRRGE